MKKFYFLFTALLTVTFVFAQSPIITMIADGDCSGGNPKVVEIYANGTVDFSMYSLEKQSNGGDWGTTTNLASLGTVTDSFVYVYSDSSDPEIFAAEYPSASPVLEPETSVVNVNGDDGIRIVMDSDMSVVDQFGADGVDGTGTAWEYKDGYAKRVNGSGPDGGFVETNWTYANSALDGGGSCQGADTFETIMGGIGTYSTQGTTEPTIGITFPSNGATLDLGTTEIDVTFVTNNFEIGGTGDGLDGHVHYYLNGTFLGMHYSNDAISYTELVPGTHTVKLQLVDNNHQPFSPDVFAESTFTIPSVVQVSTISELRAGVTDGTVYTLTGEAILTMQQAFRNQKWIEDATGAIQIDDNNGVVTTQYVRYDGITGITGTLNEFNGVMQLRPVQDPGQPSSTGNTMTPQVVTVADFNANPDMYESELVAFAGVATNDTGNWETGTNYNFFQDVVPENVLIVRTNFYDANYIGTAIPTVVINLAGIASEYQGTAQVFPRDSDDIGVTLSVNDVLIDTRNVKVAVASSQLQVAGFNAEKVMIYNANGKQVTNNTFVGNLPSGMYIAVMQNANGQTVSVKFMKK